jgi:hypothetical protein
MNNTLQISDIDQNFVKDYLEFNGLGQITTNHIIARTNMGASQNPKDWQYRLLPSAIDSYYDYLELKEARKNAKDAKWFSIAALIVSVLSLLVAVFQITNKRTY